MVPANSFGVEYLTYVLWAITPQGRPTNLGEVMPNGSKAEVHVTTGLQQFALIVTAEPYFAVSMPSDLVVVQNTIKKNGTAGIIDTVNAHYNLLPRGAYVEATGQHTVLNPVKPSDKSPLQLYEAINAIQIAEATGAEKYTPDILAKAKQELTNAQGLGRKKSQRKEMITYARGAVQDAEDARVSTLRKIEEEQQQQQMLAMQQAQQAAQEAQLAAKQQAAERAQADAQAAQARAQAAQAKAQAELAEARAAQAQAAQQTAQQATQQAEQVREKLRAQLNNVLQTQETARGLIVNMSDVLFAFNQYSLKPDTREKLAKVSGILLSYPGLKVQVEGYTDNVGSEEYNQKLSQQRADAVHDYLVSQGVPAADVSSIGYGMSNPVADNSTAAGRSQNRRVQLVVSGSAIGIQETAARRRRPARRAAAECSGCRRAARPSATAARRQQSTAITITIQRTAWSHAWPSLTTAPRLQKCFRIANMTNLNGQTILITGASSGIGEACAYAFAAQGARLLLIARRQAKLDTLRPKLTKAGAKDVHLLALDVRQRTKRRKGARGAALVMERHRCPGEQRRLEPRPR